MYETWKCGELNLFFPIGRRIKNKEENKLLVLCNRYQVPDSQHRERSKHEKSGRKEGATNLISGTVAGRYFSVQTGNRRKEGTREKERQPGGWRRSLSEHKKKNSRKKVMSDQQRKN